MRINSISGIFEGATGVKKEVNPTGYFDIDLRPCDTPTVIGEMGLPILENITWDSEGEYSPYIIFPRITGTHDTIQYNDIKIRVGGQDILRQERYSHTNTWLSIIFFVFTIITALTLLCTLCQKICEYWLFNKYDTNNGERDPPNNSHDGGKPEKELRKGKNFGKR